MSRKFFNPTHLRTRIVMGMGENFGEYNPWARIKISQSKCVKGANFHSESNLNSPAEATKVRLHTQMNDKFQYFETFPNFQFEISIKGLMNQIKDRQFLKGFDNLCDSIHKLWKDE